MSKALINPAGWTPEGIRSGTNLYPGEDSLADNRGDDGIAGAIYFDDEICQRCDEGYLACKCEDGCHCMQCDPHYRIDEHAKKAVPVPKIRNTDDVPGKEE